MIKFTNGLVLDKDFNIVKTDVYVDGNKIVNIGGEMPCDEVYDLGGNLLMPSFKNAHTHSAMTFARSFADDLPLHDWLNNMIFPMEAKLTGEDVYNLSQLAILEYLTSGITACFDMYYFPEEYAKACVDMGFRSVMTSGLNNFKENLDLLEEYYNKYNNYNELVSYKLGFHAEYTTSKELMQGIAALAEKYKAPVFVHASETKAEVDGCIERYGKTPAEFFDSLGLWKYGGAGYHSVWVTDSDLDIYKKNGVYAVLNAGSNCKLASGIAPVTKMMDKGINIAIGTDGPSSNNALDMFREMFLITAMQKINDCDASAAPATEILKAATLGSARCMGLEDCDVIDVGKTADLIEIDLHRPNMQPINNILKNIVYSGSKENVKMTMINGKILYKDGKFLHCDIDEIYAKAQAVIDRIK